MGDFFKASINTESDIQFRKSLSDDVCGIIDGEFGKFADRNGLVCDYETFAFTAAENGKVVGIIRGHSYYEEVHIGDLIVLEKYRGKGIGTRLLKAAESFFADKSFDIITLSTYEFQAPEFYRKHGYEIEFVRENKKNPKLTKYFLIKHIGR